MAVYEISGKRGRSLDEAYPYLLTVPPTSVEAERAFSAAGVLCTKLCNQLDDLKDATLDAEHCFLRASFRQSQLETIILWRRIFSFGLNMNTRTDIRMDYTEYG